MNYTEVIEELNALAQPEKVTFKEKKFGVIANHSLGIYQKDLNVLAKKIGKGKNDLALQLFDSGIYEGRVLCSKVFHPKDLTDSLAEKWLITFENWEICDSFSMGLFAKSKLALPKINEWANRTNEFEKRASFATMAAYCMHDKKSDNTVFFPFFELIVSASDDNRLYVKKAVNWALRNIGKRNIDLKHEATQIANKLLKSNSPSAQWIAKDALKEFERPNCRMSDYPRNSYRP